MNLRLEDRGWKPFKIERLFDIDKGIYLNKNDITEGQNPYVTAKVGNNGITDFIGNETLFPGNSITIEKISLSAYYQPNPFYCSHDVTVLLNPNINEKTALFINTMIKRQGIKYSYGRQAQMKVVTRETVLLPVDEQDEPDWNFMKSYIEEVYENKVNKYNEYILSVVEALGYEEIPKLNEKNWDEFFVTDLFPYTKRGKRLTKENQISGNTPYVSSTALNNGVDNFISNEDNVRRFSNCLTIANSGSVGASFYHPYEFVASDHVTHLKNENMNQYVYLFIATMTSRFSEKYNFNREINDQRIKREKIMLPINEENSPDFIYMEQYIKNMMIKKYSQSIKN